jgi:hypothetical protein
VKDKTLLNLTYEVLVFFFFCCLALILRIKALPLLGTHFIGGTAGDSGLYVWLSQIALKSLRIDSWFVTPAFYPYGLSLAWSDNFVLPALLIQLVGYAGLSLPVSYNSLILLALALSGYCTYRLGIFLTSQRWLALLAGVSFASYSFITEHAGHPQLQFTFWLPLTLLIFLRAFLYRERLSASLLGISVGFSFLTTVYYALFSVSLILVLSIALLLKYPRYREFSEITAFVLMSTLGLLPFLPFIIPYLWVQDAFGGRGLYEAYYFSTHLLSFFSTGSLNSIYGWTHTVSHNEAHLFGGWALYILIFIRFLRSGRIQQVLPLLTVVSVLVSLSAAIPQLPGEPWIKYLSALSAWIALISGTTGLICKRSSPSLGIDWESLLEFTALFFLILSLGPLGNDSKGDVIFSPYMVWHHIVPGFGGVRALGRVGVVFFLCLSLLAASSVYSLLEKKTLAQRVIAFSAIATLIVLENWNRAFPLETVDTAPPVLSQLNSLPPAAAVFLPFTRHLDKHGTVAHWSDYATLNVLYMNWAVSFNKPILNGYSGLRSHFMMNYPRWTANFPSVESIRALRRVPSLQYIVVASQFIPHFKKADFESRLAQFKEDLELLAVDPTGTYLLKILPLRQVNDPVHTVILPPYKKGILRLHEVISAASDKELESIEIRRKQKDSISLSIPSPDDVAGFPLIPFNGPVSPAQFEIVFPESTLPLRGRISLDLDDKTFTILE